eukprot:8483564-Lingulodinium_polyedra.AAC.1
MGRVGSGWSELDPVALAPRVVIYTSHARAIARVVRPRLARVDAARRPRVAQRARCAFCALCVR